MGSDLHKKLEKIPANRQLLNELYSQDKINDTVYLNALDFLYPRNQWLLWGMRLCLAVGTGLLLAGIICFSAFNWAKIPPFVRLYSIQTGLAVTVIASLYFKLENLLGKVFLLVASVLVGVFLAVFGQIYQTGADAYQLFMAWTILTFVWVLCSRFVACWLVWLVIASIFIMTMCEQAFVIKDYIASWLVGALWFFFLVLKEILVKKQKYQWLAYGWLRTFMLGVTLLFMGFLQVDFLDDLVWGKDISFIGLAVCFAPLFYLYWYYRYKLLNLWNLAGVLFSCFVLSLFLLFYIFDEIELKDGTIVTLFFTLYTLAVTYLLVNYLRILAKGKDAD